MATTPALLSAPELADLAGIHRRNAVIALTRALEGRPWRGAHLDVRETKGRGGRSGIVYRVALESLPIELQERYQPPETDSTPRRNTHNQIAFKLDVLGEVDRLVAAGEGVTAAVREVCADPRFRYPYGEKRGQHVGERTVFTWLNGRKTKKSRGLMRRRPKNAGVPQVIISRQLDRVAAEAGIAPEQLTAIRERIVRRIKGWWQEGGTARTIAHLARPKLMQWTRKEAAGIPLDVLYEACLVPEAFIRRYQAHKNVHTYRKDAGRAAAELEPRIRRDRSHLRPGDWLAADVHPGDILFEREDGTTVTIRMIVWMDLATNRIFVTLHIPKKGRAVRQEHVIESFIALCADPAWGVPTRIYADRGGEYNWLELAAPLSEGKHKVEFADLRDVDADMKGRAGLHRALPYRPASKVIETAFSSLEGAVLKMLPGHIGGERMRKKTENQGKVPVPYKHGLEQLKRDIHTAVEYYHLLPHSKSSHLAGISPRERFGEFLTEGEFRPITLDRRELELVFCDKVTRSVEVGGEFTLDGTWYRSDLLMPHAGFRLTIGRPKFGDRQRLFVFDDDGEPLCDAYPSPTFRFGDPRGAGEQSRRSKVLRGQMRALEAEADRGDPVEDMRDAVRAAPPIPEPGSAGTACVDPELLRQAKFFAALPAPEPPDEGFDEKDAILEELERRSSAA